MRCRVLTDTGRIVVGAILFAVVFLAVCAGYGVVVP